MHTKITLKNGLRIVLVPLQGNQTVTAMVLVEAGSNYEDKKVNGISHFLEHMCFKGTENRTCTQITFELDAIGAESNAFTGNEYTGYYAKSETRHLPKLISVLSDIYLNSTFPADEIEKEKGVIIEEINMYEDMPHRAVHEVFESLLYGDTPAGRTILGPREGIRAMTRENFVAYRAAHYHPQSTVVVVTGGFTKKTALDLIKKEFSGMKTGKKQGKPAVVEKQKQPQVAVQAKKSDQTHLVLGFRTVGLHDSQNWALSVLTTALGQGMSSRLFKKLREDMGVCYYVRAGLSAYTDHGVLSISSGVATDRLEEATEAILNEVKWFIHNDLSKEELAKVKALKLGQIAMGLESSDSYADFYGFQELHHEKIMSAKQQAKKIAAVTAKDVRAAAKKFFVQKHLSMAVVGPKAEKERLEAILKTF